MFSGGWKFNKSFSHLSSVKHLKGYSLKPWIVKVIEHDWLMAMALINLANSNRRNGSFTTTNHMVFSVRNFRQIKSPILPEIWVNGLEKCIYFNWNKFEIKENDKRKFISHNHSDKTTGSDWFHSLITFHRNKQQTEGKRRKTAKFYSTYWNEVTKVSLRRFCLRMIKISQKSELCIVWLGFTLQKSLKSIFFILSCQYFFILCTKQAPYRPKKNTSHTPLHIMLYSRNGRWRNVQISNDKCFRWEKMQSASDH